MTNTLLNNLMTGGSKTFTENGDVAYTTTYNYNLDFFASQDNGMVEKFVSAFMEDKVLAIKNLFYLRDIKNGKGRRNSTVEILKKLGKDYEEVYNAILPIIPQLGRWDDVLKTYPDISVKSRKRLMELVKGQLGQDILAANKGKSISLLAKWMPTIQSKSYKTASLANNLAKELGLTPREYRKMVSGLRKHYDLVETRLTNKDYTFDYSYLPQGALKKYLKAFNRNDNVRYEEFKELIQKDPTVAKTSNYYPHDLVGMLKTDKDLANSLWKALPKDLIDGNVLVMRDGSGSMTQCYINTSVTPLQVADALSIYTSERLSGPFKNTFMTFSERPRMIKLRNGVNLSEKVEHLKRYDEIANTDISKAFQLILDSSIGIPVEEQLDTLVVISDMQFDSCVEGKSNYENMREKFTEAGVKIPSVVFWNVGTYEGFPVNHNQLSDVRLVNGFSKTILEGVCKNVSAVEHMLNTLSKYDSLVQDLSLTK